MKDRQRPEPLELSFRTRRGLRELTALVGGPASTGGRSESASKELSQAPPALLCALPPGGLSQAHAFFDHRPDRVSWSI